MKITLLSFLSVTFVTFVVFVALVTFMSSKLEGAFSVQQSA